MANRIEITTISVEVRQFLEEWYSAEPILRRRYARCDRRGHSGDKVDRRCGYCFRLLDRTLEVDRVMRARKGISLLLQPMDAPYIVRRREVELVVLESEDLLYGLRKLKEQANGTRK